jgi:hypothetical protein
VTGAILAKLLIASPCCCLPSRAALFISKQVTGSRFLAVPQSSSANRVTAGAQLVDSLD